MKKHIKSVTRLVLPVLIAAVLTYGSALTGMGAGDTGAASPQVIEPAAATAVVGGQIGGCGIAVGAVGLVVAAGLAGVTVGFGAALGISAIIHVGAIICAS